MGETVMAAIDAAARAAADGRVRAVGYLRVSTEEQVKGYGIGYTRRRTAAHIAHKGWEHVGTFADEGESGTLPWQEREGAGRIMELAVRTPRPFDLVCVHETRAIGREKRVFWEWVWALQDLGIYVAIADEDLDNTTEEGESRMRDEADEAFEELARIRKRTQGGIQEKAELGGFPGGQARYGYRIANKGVKGEQTLALDECDGGEACTRADPCGTVHEADVLRFARRVAVRVGANWRKVALALNDEGLLTRSGKPWAAPNIRGRLMDEALLNARFVFRHPKNGTQLGTDGEPVWGKSVTLPLPPVFTPDEVAELRAAVAAAPTRRPPAEGRTYPLSGRLLSLCGSHYVGGSPAANEALHYVCSGKREQYAGAGGCRCPQVWAQGTEAWAWERVCELLGDEDRLSALTDRWAGSAAARKVDHSSRLASLDRRIREQTDTIDLVTVVVAKQVTRDGLTGSAAEAAVEKKLRPLCDERARLRSERGEIEVWQSEAQRTDRRVRELQALARSVHGRWEKCTPEQQAEWLALLDVEVRLLETPLPMRRGLACPVGEWFQEHERLVPVLDDQVWGRIVELEGFPHGGLVARQRGGLAPRAVLEALLKKARTGVAWTELDAEHGSTGLIGHWRRWNRQGRWSRVMEVMNDGDGEPVAPRHRLPKMELTGVVRPGVTLAATNADEGSDRKSRAQE
ncbi:recombinase family protein [Streptomyces sp. bgisy126]|uniref:recombinase family protein n=1 Tax=unclassified Streptomyces TaxID=2593676 RepID=UPI003EB7F234